MKLLARITGIVLLLTAAIGINLAQDEPEDYTLEPGEEILLQGQVLDTAGNPVEGAVVEIWQTDNNGIYNHPNDSDESERDPNFQYFGTSAVDDNGYYAFLTIKPAAYDRRPPHIHIKVKLDGETLLTTQFYFEEDRETVESDGAFQGGDNTLFVSTTAPMEEGDYPVATNDLVIEMGGETDESLQPTAAQTEGPYYPVVDFSDADNNLISTADEDKRVTPVLDDMGAMMEFTLLNLNTASSDDFLTIPDMSSRMVREFNEYRPYISIQQFRREIGKYVDQTQVAAYEAYVYVPVDVDNSDAETLKQIPGIDETIAQTLIDARPFDSNEAFLEALGAYLSAPEVYFAANYLAS